MGSGINNLSQWDYQFQQDLSAIKTLRSTTSKDDPVGQKAIVDARQLLLDHERARQHIDGIARRRQENLGAAGEMIGHIVVGAAISTVAVGLSAMILGPAAATTFGGAFLTGVFGGGLSGVVGVITEVEAQKSAYGKAHDKRAIVNEFCNSALTGFFYSGFGALLPTILPAAKGGLSVIMADGTLGFLGGAFEATKESVKTSKTVGNLAAHALVGGIAGSISMIALGRCLKSAGKLFTGAWKTPSSSTSGALERNQTIRMALYPRTSHLELVIDDDMINKARAILLDEKNIARFTKNWSFAEAKRRAMDGKAGMVIADIAVTAEEKATLEAFNATYQTTRVKFQNCGNGAFDAISKCTGLIIPAPFNQTPAVGTCYLGMMKLMGHSRVTNIEYIGTRPMRDLLGISLAELTLAAGIATATTVSLIDEIRNP